MDFVFGTYINDALKLANHRAVRSGLQHQHRIEPADPAPGERVTVTILTSGDSAVTDAALYYTTDESLPAGSRGVAQNGQVIPFERVSVVWDSLMWDYVTRWQAVIPAQPENTLVRYVISGWGAEREIYADYPDAMAQVQHAAMIHFKNIPADSVFDPGDPTDAHVFNYHVDMIRPPEWARDAIIYQVFLDRFYPGENQPWKQTDKLNDFMGGTLWGVRDKLDYLAALGINTIWLSPTWVSPSYHGYDVADYDRVEPRLGGDEALRAVIAGAHARGMRVLLDMACNHISNEHPFFLDALNDESSPYRDWFFFGEKYEHGYMGFFNVRTMPELNLANPAARDWMVNNAVRWLTEFDVDGYRLDFANGPGPDFWTYFRRACKAAKPDCLLFGEIIEPSDTLLKYAGRLDGCLDFPTNDALRRTFGWQVWDRARFEAFVDAHAAYFGDRLVMPTFIDNHDMDRFSHIAKDNHAQLEAAVTAQFALQKPVIILYGTEVGLKQPISTREQGLDVCRVPMEWEAQDAAVLALYQAQIQARKGQ